MLIIFVLLPFWTSLLVRTTAWIALLQTNGVVNSTLMAHGPDLRAADAALHRVRHHPRHDAYPSALHGAAALFGDEDHRPELHARGDVDGQPADPGLPAYSVYLPMSLPGLSAGALLVFIISVGYYITPALVGGTDGQMISNIIAFHMQQSNNWGLAAALGSLLLALILVSTWPSTASSAPATSSWVTRCSASGPPTSPSGTSRARGRCGSWRRWCCSS
jgi:putative spermidine/putrescine transport system permease protein